MRAIIDKGGLKKPGFVHILIKHIMREGSVGIVILIFIIKY
jgi:hypothetical protein